MSIAEHNVPPHVQVPVHVLPTPAQTGLTVKGSHGSPPGSPMRPEIGCVQSFPDCLCRDPSVISSSVTGGDNDGCCLPLILVFLSCARDIHLALCHSSYSLLVVVLLCHFRGGGLIDHLCFSL